MTRVLVVVLLLAPLAAPLVGAHTATNGLPADEMPEPETTPRSGYTGPGKEPYLNFFLGAYIYGSVQATPLGTQIPRNIHGNGDWLVWEDAASTDIYAYNIPAGVGQYLTRDGSLQRNPDISGNVVVWEDYRNNSHTDVYAYFLDTGEARRVSSGPGNHQHPSISGHLIAWEDDRDKNLDIYGYDLTNKTQFPIVTTPDRESDPFVKDGVVYYRTYRFNVFDLFATSATSGETYQITADTGIQGAAFTSGKDVFFLSQFFTAWSLDRYDPVLDRVIHTKLKFQDTTPTPISGDHLIASVFDLGFHQLVAENLTSGSTVHITGNLLLTDSPFLIGRTAYATVRTVNGTTLLTIEISPFAFSARPVLNVLSPQSGAPWMSPVGVQGILKREGSWGDPATFTYRVDDGAPQAIPVTERWRFTLDPAGVDVGRHIVTVRATFREGPPTETAFALVIPRPSDTIDVEKAGNEFHAARVFGAINTYFVTNPVSYVLVVLVIVLLLLVAFRIWIVVRPKRERLVAEYVRPRSD